jgi:hypothetical protein
MSNQTLPATIFKTNSSADKYVSAVYYNNFVFQDEYYPYQFNGSSDKRYYALINNKNEPIYPKDSELAYFSDRNGNQYKILSFVAQAFREMKEYYDSHKFTDKIQVNGSVYSELNPVKGYSDPTALYMTNLQNTFNIFFNTFLTDVRRQEIKNIYNFMTKFIEFLTIGKSFININLSYFLSSKVCPLESNGITISFRKDMDLDDLSMKADKYISDPNFDVFYDAAKRFGFMVDKSAPWRIVADLGSPVIKSYYQQSNLKSVDEVFDKCYSVGYLTDIYSIKNIVLSFWNTYVTRAGTVVSAKEKMGCSSLFAEVTTLHQIDPEHFNLYFDDSWLLRLYVYSRLIEEDIHINQSMFEEIVEKTIKLHAHVSRDAAAEYVFKSVRALRNQQSPKKVLLTDADLTAKLIRSQVQNGAVDTFYF